MGGERTHKVVSKKESRLGRSRNSKLQDETEKRRSQVADHDPNSDSLVTTGDETSGKNEDDLHETLRDGHDVS